MQNGGGAPLAFTNPQVQRLRRLIGQRRARLDDGAFVIEGAMLAAEALAAGWMVEAQYIAPGATPVAGPPTFMLRDGVAERVSATTTAQGVFAVVTTPPADTTVLQHAGFVVVADQVTDPGNLGTIIRSAEASGADAVVVTPGTVDVYNPKVLRATAGSLFHVPVVAASIGDVRAAGLRVIATSSHRGTAHTTADWTGRVAILAGSEAHGVDEDAPVDDWVRIDHRGRTESLNVAMAVTVLCFEAARQRDAR